jgi:uncharacterized protein (TIGR00288 family)
MREVTPTEALPEWSGEPDPEALLASRSSGGFPDPLHDCSRGPGGEVSRHEYHSAARRKNSMTMHLNRVPHVGSQDPLQVAPNAALLIDFDNVTMGMRSDLSKELKTLLNSDVIKGKVTVQRAYADWRRYPQYIVPLSEASVDLIFAPAYGSSKKNATDIRMAIDGIELVFIRPEIGTYILLTGDSDFSSLVLKLKEYGKYVIGVGIQESSSDILVQNCDEYYSYTSLSGLRKTTDSDRQPVDPWVLVERAVDQMRARDDVMRSDRLKQVMVELDPGFDEGEYGFSKFSRFLTEASSRGLVQIKKLENGQHEVAPTKGGGAREVEEVRAEEPRSRGLRRGGGRDEGRSRTRERAPESRDRGGQGADAPVLDGPLLQAAYELLRRGLELKLAHGREAVRDSDVKRKMLELDADFDEAKLGFSKFSRFLLQASDHAVVTLNKLESGNYEVSLRTTGDPESSPPPALRSDPPRVASEPTTEPGPQHKESALVSLGRRFGLRLGPLRSREEASPPPTLAPSPGPVVTSSSPTLAPSPGPVVTSSPPTLAPSPGPVVTSSSPTPPVAPLDPYTLGLPTETDAQVRYLTNRYKGVGKKTAEKLVEGFGENLFTVLQEEPQRVQDLIPQARAENVLEQWKADFDRRTGHGAEKAPDRSSRDRGDRSKEDPRRRGGEGGERESGEERGGRGGRGRRGERAPKGAQREQRSGERAPEPRPNAIPQAQGSGGEPEPTVHTPVSTGPVERVATQESSQVELPVQEAPPVPAAPERSPAPTGSQAGDELEGLEPSRLHTRTSRRGGRR